MNADEKYSSIGVHLRSSAASNVPLTRSDVSSS